MANPCWKGYTQVGMKKKGGKKVPNCVPSSGVPKATRYKKVDEEIETQRYCPKCKKDETRSECRYGTRYWDMFSLPSSIMSNQLKYNITQVHPANESKEPDHEHSMARSEISTIISAAKRLKKNLKGEGNIEAWVQSKITKAADYIDAAADYLDSGEHNVHGSMDEFNIKTFGEFMIEASGAWQRKEGKNPEGGLNKKGIASYRKENPGSKLSLAVTTPPSELTPGSKKAKRRKSFCARMGGMPGPMKDEKGRPTRKALSLRKWNC